MNKGLITGLPLFKRGKVRDIYDLGDRLLIVATDRISCFDVVLPTEIPYKGKILNALSANWFREIEDIVPHHLPFGQMVERVGKKKAEKMRDISMAIYLRAREMAEARGIIIADTKIEFGLVKGEVIVIDELLTPDSSRFWPMEDYRPGVVPQSFDKQYVRDYLLSLNWDTRPPAPILPPEIVLKTQDKYAEALRRLTTSPGRCFG